MSAELNRLIANLIKQGTIAEVNAAAGLVRVQHGELTTEWLPYFVAAAGGVSVHRPPSVGENCTVLSPSGETANGLVLCGLASTQHPQPSASAAETVVKYPDNAETKYNHETGEMTISGVKTVNVKAATVVNINCPETNINGKLNVKGLLTYSGGMSGSGGGGTNISGNFSHSGNFTNTGKMSSNGVELSTHTHPDTTSGGNTGIPNK